jgi:transposase
MIGRDGRKVGRRALADLRKRAVQLVHDGQSPEDIAANFGFNRNWIYRTLARYNENGESGLEEHPAPGREPILDEKKQASLKKVILGKTPEQLKFEYALWTTDQVSAYIQRRWKVVLSISTITRLLHKMGLSFQKPIVKAFQQDPKAVQRWLDVDYPQIRKRAMKEKAEIYFGDEAGLRSDHHAGRTWGERGKTPIVRATGARFGFNVVSAVNNRGRFCFMIIDHRFCSGDFIDFMDRLIKWKRHKVFLIVDGHPAHKAKKVKDWVEVNAEKISLFYLPPYSPELNPTELTWNTMKSDMGKRTIVGPDSMKTQATSILNGYRSNPQFVMSFYNENHVVYAKL